jgi:hypothetical protein
VATRVVDLLRKRGIWLDAEDEDSVAEEHPMLAHLAQSSMRGRLAFGDGVRRPVRLMDSCRPETIRSERAGTALGFNLDAEVRVSAWNRLHRERLCRYLLRPPLAKVLRYPCPRSGHGWQIGGDHGRKVRLHPEDSMVGWNPGDFLRWGRTRRAACCPGSPAQDASCSLLVAVRGSAPYGNLCSRVLWRAGTEGDASTQGRAPS